LSEKNWVFDAQQTRTETISLKEVLLLGPAEQLAPAVTGTWWCLRHVNDLPCDYGGKHSSKFSKLPFALDFEDFHQVI